MLIETALMTYLLAQSGITNIVGDRIHFVRAPQETTKPYLIIEKLDGSEVASHDGPAGLGNPRFEFGAYAKTYSVAKTISAALKTALDGYNGTMSGLKVDIPERADESDDYDDNLGLYVVFSEYEVWHSE